MSSATTDDPTMAPAETPTGPHQAAPPLLERAPRASLATFAVFVGAAGALFAYRGRAQWFFQDDYAYIVQRDGGSLDGLLLPHQQHWVTVPVAIYRVLWNIFGLHSYVPYLAVSIAFHLAVVVLLRAVLRRSGVSPWMATITASILLFFGSGSENVVWAFMIAFTGSLAYGLAHLLVVDRTIRSPLLYAAGTAFGVLSLMCSNVGLVMLGTVGLTIWLRRGWRAAAAATLPSAVVYGLWLMTYGGEDGGAQTTNDVGLILRFALRGLETLVSATTQTPVVAAGLVVVTALGLGLTVWPDRRSWPALRMSMGIPLGLAAGATGFYLVVARSRVERFDIDYATRGRFLYVALALLLPLIALTADAVARRWKLAALPVVVLLVAGIPGNVSDISIRSNKDAKPELVLAVASSPALSSASRSLRPFARVQGFAIVTAGWLADGVRDGRIPGDFDAAPDTEAEALSRLALSVVPARPNINRCTLLEGTEDVEISSSNPIGFSGSLLVTVVTPEGGLSAPHNIGSFDPKALISTAGPLTVRIKAAEPLYPVELCR